MKKFFFNSLFLSIVFSLASLASRRNEKLCEKFPKDNNSWQGEDSPKKFSPRTPSPKKKAPRQIDRAPSKIPQKEYFKKRHSQSVEKYFQPKK